ncbi:hypothetical protein [Natrinema thermotolerans]
MCDRVLEGTVTSLYGPAHPQRDHLRPIVRTLADGKHVAIVADDDHGPEGLLEIARSMLALRGIGRTRPPPTMVLSDPPFACGDAVRVPVDETTLANLYVQDGDVIVLESTD